MFLSLYVNKTKRRVLYKVALLSNAIFTVTEWRICSHFLTCIPKSKLILYYDWEDDQILEAGIYFVYPLVIFRNNCPVCHQDVIMTENRWTISYQHTCLLSVLNDPVSVYIKYYLIDGVWLYALSVYLYRNSATHNYSTLYWRGCLMN